LHKQKEINPHQEQRKPVFFAKLAFFIDFCRAIKKSLLQKNGLFDKKNSSTSYALSF
jgi:hypothetical protein